MFITFVHFIDAAGVTTYTVGSFQATSDEISGRTAVKVRVVKPFWE
jgi:hypothetical protein